MKRDLIFGYARVSTEKQNIERQERNIKRDYPEVVIVKEYYTGTKSDRPNWVKLLKRVHKAAETDNVTIVFDSVSRMARNAEEGIKTYFDLFDRGVHLVFLKESHINTDVYSEAITQSIPETGNDIADIYIDATNRVIKLLAEKQIRKAFDQAEKEVMDLRQRTKEGIETARINGKQIGMQEGRKLVTKKQIEMVDRIRKMSKDFGGNMSDTECMEVLHLARGTFYKYKRIIRAAGTEETE